MSYTKEFSFSQNKPVEEFLASFNRGIEITFILKDPVAKLELSLVQFSLKTLILAKPKDLNFFRYEGKSESLFHVKQNLVCVRLSCS